MDTSPAELLDAETAAAAFRKGSPPRTCLNNLRFGGAQQFLVKNQSPD